MKKIFLAITLILLASCATHQVRPQSMMISDVEGEYDFDSTLAGDNKEKIIINSNDIEKLKGSIQKISMLSNEMFTVNYPLEKIELPSESFKTALENSLKQVGLFNEKTGIYVVQANIEQIDRMRFTSSTMINVAYRVVSSATGKTIFTSNIAGIRDQDVVINGEEYRLGELSLVEQAVNASIKGFIVKFIASQKNKS